MKSIYLYIIVFISGASVLALEILGTRILGPFYGVSLFLWSALITVTLAALSVGYALGGRWADQKASRSRLCLLIAGAGIWTLLIPWIKYPVLSLTEPLGLRTAVLVTAFIMFALPLTLLGMVSPYAIKLKTASLDEVGRSAGNLYAISTVASVLAALLTGFILIPNVGVNRLTLAIGLVLLLTSALGLLANRKAQTKTLTAASIVLVCFFAIWATPNTVADSENGLIAIEQSPYAELRVVDTHDKRHLLIDGGTHTIVDASSWESYFPYVAVMDLTKSFFEQPGEMLLIGLGGGSVVKSFAQDGWQVEAVEIDAIVTKFARAHFGLEPSEGKVYHLDGRQFLLSRQQRYSIIAMDAFGSSSIPFHLVTKESFSLIESRLKPGGILTINTESSGWNHMLIRSLTATLKQSFESVLALPTYRESASTGNIVLLASNRELKLSHPIEHDVTDLNYRNSPAYYQNFAWDNRFIPNLNNAPVLTDDLNPVDLWAEAINLKARQGLHHYFEESGVSW